MNTDELDWSLNLNDFELSLIRDILSNGSTPVDQTLALFSATNVEFSGISTVLPQHQSKSPENLTTFPAMGGTLPAVREAIDVAPNSDFTAGRCNGMFSGAKDHRAPPLAKEAIRSLLPGRRYRGVSQRRSGRFSAEIHVRNPGKKGTRLWLGTYNTAEEAAMAFDRAAFKARGSNAVLNFPDLIGTYNVSPEKDTIKILSPMSEGSPSSLSLESSRNNHLKRKITAL